MNEPQQPKQSPKNKTGADGLSKKERRALKVQQNKPDKAASEQKVKNDVSAVETNKKDDNKGVGKIIIKQSNSKEQTLNEGKTKAELKAERKVQFEKQQLLANSVKTKENVKEKGETESKEKQEDALSKAQLRAERRALQEKQREAKAKAEHTKKPQTKPNMTNTALNKENTIQKAPAKKRKVFLKKDGKSNISHPHLQMVEHMCYDTPIDVIETIKQNIHPAFVELGARFAFKTIVGANARCLALLAGLKQCLTDYLPPANQEFCRSFETYLQNCIKYLQKCRPLSASMRNMLRFFNLSLTKVDTNLSDSEKKEDLISIIDTYVENEIGKAGLAVSLTVLEKISNDDVILTYGCSSLVEKILLDAKTKGKTFRVIIADSRPSSEGRALLVRLLNAGISCSYVFINSLSFIMNQVTKVLLGSHSLLANGFVMSRTGAAIVALIAKDFSKPVLICCETYKFCERVQTDSYVYNEIGDSNRIMEKNTKKAANTQKDCDNVIPLHLSYDVTPPDFVSAVITEVGILPCTSVPVVLRFKPSEFN